VAKGVDAAVFDSGLSHAPNGNLRYQVRLMVVAVRFTEDQIETLIVVGEEPAVLLLVLSQEGTATELLQTLNLNASDDTKKARAWPKDARTMSSRVRRIAPLLRQVGLDVSFQTEGHQKTKKITLTRNSMQASDRSGRTEFSCNGGNNLTADSGHLLSGGPAAAVNALRPQGQGSNRAVHERNDRNQTHGNSGI